MYLETLDTTRAPLPAQIHCRRSLSGDFVFLSQNEQVRYELECRPLLWLLNDDGGERQDALTGMC